MVSYLHYAIIYLLACTGLGDLDLYEDTLFPDESAAALFTGCPLSYDNDLDLLRGDLDHCLTRGELQIKKKQHQLCPSQFYFDLGFTAYRSKMSS